MEVEAAQGHTGPVGAILDELRLGPVVPKDLKQRLEAKFKGLTAEQWTNHLQALVATEDIHARRKPTSTGKPGKAIEAYVLGPPPAPPPPPRELAPAAILRELQSGPLSPAELKKRVKQNVSGLADKDYGAVIQRLLDGLQVHARRKLNKDGKPGKPIERLGLGPLPPADFVLPVLAKLDEMQRAAVAAGVDARAFSKELLAGLAAKGISGSAPNADEASSDREQVLRGLGQLVARDGQGALIPVRRLRSLLRLDKARFDSVLLELFAEDRVILHHHDYVGSLSEGERNELVLDRHGNYYIGVALRGEA